MRKRQPIILKFLILIATLAWITPAPAREMEVYPSVKLQTLDKITARTSTFEANVGSTVKFGSLYIKVQSCQKAPPVEQPEAAAFLQIWEAKPGEEKKKIPKDKEDSQWVFSGWMFSSSPALSAMDHPIYDVWVLDCIGDKVGDETFGPPAPVKN
jgi:hypothetical protein